MLVGNCNIYLIVEDRAQLWRIWSSNMTVTNYESMVSFTKQVCGKDVYMHVKMYGL